MKRSLRCKLGLHKDIPLECNSNDLGMYADNITKSYDCTFKCVLCGRIEKRDVDREMYYWWLHNIWSKRK